LKDQFLKCIDLIDRATMWQGAGVAVLILFGAGLEAIGIGLIFPFIKLIAAPGEIHQMEWVSRYAGPYLPKEERAMLVFISFGLLGLFVFKNMFLSIVYYAQARFTNVNLANASTRLFGYYLCGPYHLHLARNSAEMINNAISVVGTVFLNVFMAFLTLLTEFFVICGILVVLLLITPYFTLGAFAMLGVSVLLFYGF